MPLNEISFNRMATRSSSSRCVLERTAVSKRGSISLVKTARSCKDNQLDRSESIETSIDRHANRVSSRPKRSCVRSRITKQSRKGHTSTPYFQCLLPDEVLLNLFSFLPAKDICTLACVCQRFVKICKDSTSWEQLYKSIYKLDYPLKRNDRGLYERIPHGALTKDSWRKAFISLYHSHHVVCKESQKNCDHVKYHASLEEAIKSVPENGIIIVHPGIYREELFIKKTVTIIGAGCEDKPEVTIEGSNATVVKFVSGSSTSYIRNISIKYVGGDGASSRPSCLEIGSDCSATIHRCNVASNASAGSTVYVHGKNARPRVIDCSITDSENVGIFIDNYAQGIYENNEISNNKLAGVCVKDGGNPTMRNNKVHHGRDVGFFISDNGRGRYDGNDVFSNQKAGFGIRTGGNPTVVRCKIHDGLDVGIDVRDEGRGQFLENKIYANTYAGVRVTSRNNPTIRENEIFDGQQGGVFVYNGARCVIECNNIHGNALAGINIRSQSNPVVRHNKIHDGLSAGIFVDEGGLGLIKDNEIYSNTSPGIAVGTGVYVHVGEQCVVENNNIHSNTSAGIQICSQSNPVVRHNKIHHGLEFGIYVDEGGLGLIKDNEIYSNTAPGITVATGVYVHVGEQCVIENNNIHSNAFAGIEICSQSNPVVRDNKIHHGLQSGIYVYEGGLGLIKDNEIYSNTLSGIDVTTGSSPVMRNNKIHSGKQVGVYFSDKAAGVLEDNEIFNHKYSGILIRTSGNPEIRRNKIWGCQDLAGVFVKDFGCGELEENEIFDNAMAGVSIQTGSNPILRRNKIHDGQAEGICICNEGKGLLENNDIFRNASAGVVIGSSSFPVLRGNRIFEGGTTGIEITNGAGGVLDSNEIFNNKFSGISKATGMKTQVSNNNIYGNKELIKSTIESGFCLYTVSGKTCYPMHDYYRCNTCDRSENFTICVNCIKQCHQGHDVEFVERDGFYCDCGAGITMRAPCQLLNKDSGLAQKSSTEYESMHTMITRSKSRALNYK